jgi:flagellar protein FliJ
MSFHFRFDSILQLRCRERDVAASAVEEVHRAISLVEAQLQETQAELNELANQRKNASTGNVAVNSLLDLQRHQLILIGNTQHLLQQISTLEQEKTRREIKLMKAQQAVKSFEKLREQQQEEAQRQEALRLQSRLDEWSNTRVVSEKGI